MSGIGNSTYTGVVVTTPIPIVIPVAPTSGIAPSGGIYDNPQIQVDNNGRIRALAEGTNSNPMISGLALTDTILEATMTGQPNIRADLVGLTQTLRSTDGNTRWTVNGGAEAPSFVYNTKVAALVDIGEWGTDSLRWNPTDSNAVTFSDPGGTVQMWFSGNGTTWTETNENILTFGGYFYLSGSRINTLAITERWTVLHISLVDPNAAYSTTIALPNSIGSEGQYIASISGALQWVSPTPPKKLQVLEMIAGQCDGRTVVSDSGTITLPDVTAICTVNSETFSTVTGSDFTYTPPSGTKQVIYQFNFHCSREVNYSIIHLRFLIEDDTSTYQEVTQCRCTLGISSGIYGLPLQLRYVIQVDDSLSATDSTSIADCKVKDWTSDRGMKIEARVFKDDTSWQIDLHDLYYWDGDATTYNGTVTLPSLTITAIGTA